MVGDVPDSSSVGIIAFGYGSATNPSLKSDIEKHLSENALKKIEFDLNLLCVSVANIKHNRSYFVNRHFYD